MCGLHIDVGVNEQSPRNGNTFRCETPVSNRKLSEGFKIGGMMTSSLCKKRMHSRSRQLLLTCCFPAIF